MRAVLPATDLERIERICVRSLLLRILAFRLPVGSSILEAEMREIDRSSYEVVILRWLERRSGKQESCYVVGDNQR